MRKAISALSATALFVSCVLPFSAEAGIGRTQGNFVVGRDGSANYSIPIWSPSGPRGVKPNLAFTYNSNVSQSYLGIGWSISGLSSITRCNRTTAQDGAPAAIQLTSNDAFCLDGKRLRLTSSENLSTYGQASTTYQTEIADFANVTAHGTSGNGPAYFTVQGKDGYYYEYGNVSTSQNSAVLATGTINYWKWMLDKVSDRLGNTLLIISYRAPGSTLSGTTDPDQISWCPTSAGGTSFAYTMKFAYGTNVAQSSPVGYTAATFVQNTDLLTSVAISYSGTVVKDYFLTYSASPTTLANRLTQVLECADSAQSNCLLPTTLTYQNGQAGVSTGATSVGSAPMEVAYSQYDLNGDGYPDLIYPATSGTTTVIYVRFGSSTGFGSPINTGLPWASPLVGDVFGTGKDGLLINNGGTWYYYTWNGSSFSGASTGIAFDTTASTAQLTDVNGDGLPDLVTLYTSGGVSVKYRLNTSQQTAGSYFSPTVVTGYSNSSLTNAYYVTPASSNIRAFDFNGDGMADVAVYQATAGNCTWGVCTTEYVTVYSLVAQTNGTFLLTQLTTGSTVNGGIPYIRTLFGDFNNDGCTDVATFDGVYVSACNGNAASHIASSTPLAFVDWDGDGRKDVLVAGTSGTLSVLLSTGTGLSGTATSTTIPANCSPFVFDGNGDGLDDVMCLTPSATNSAPYAISFYLHNGPMQRPDLLASATDGFGVTVSPTYTTLTNGSYQLGADASYPYKNYVGAYTVVNGFTATDGTGTPGAAYTTTVNYANAWMNLAGRGFAGFEDIRFLDSRTGFYEWHTYRLDWPYTGTPLAVNQYQTDDATPLHLSVSTLASVMLDSTTYNQRFLVYPSQIVDSTYEYGGAKNGSLITQSATSNTFDNWGNATTVATTVTDEDSSSPYYGQTWTSTTTSSVAPNTSYWCLNQPTQVQIAKTSLGTPAVTRTVQYSVDYVNCRATQQVVEPSSPSYKVTTAWTFDSFGNKAQETVSGVGMSVRTTILNWGTTGQFPISVSNPLSQTTNLSYNYALGKISGRSTPNAGSNTTSWSYDPFGRFAQETKPDGTYTTAVYMAAAAGVDPRVKTDVWVRHFGSDGSQIRSDDYYMDNRNRTVDSYGYEVIGSAYLTSSQGFDQFGQKSWEAMPYQTTSGTQYTPNFKQTYAYDPVGRLTLTSRPISATNATAANTSVTYAGRTKTITDPQGKVTAIISTVVGRMARTTDHNGYYIGLTYDGFGNVVSVVDSAGTTLLSATYQYGIDAFQTAVTDMDLGAQSRTYDALGEITTYTDAKNQSFSLTYDALSRPLTRTEPDQTTVWTWGNSASSYNIGRLQSVSISGGASESYAYDSVGRLSTKSVVTDQTYALDYAYNAQGYLDTLTFPTSTSSTRVKLKYGYNAGILSSVTDFTTGSAGTVYWSAKGVGSWGQVASATLGNGVVTSRNFDAVTGWQNSVQAGVGGGASLSNQSYLYDAVGNITQRQENNLGLSENFFYDNLYRLSYSTLGGTTNLSLTYDATGNILTRSDVGAGATWTYDSAKKHAVRTAGSGNSYAYDANGNMMSRNGSSVTWTSYNYPKSVATASESAAFTYDANRRRTSQTYMSSSGTETTYYVGGVLEKVQRPGGLTDWRHYVFAGREPVAVISRQSSGVNTVHYFVGDNQNSIQDISDGSGNLTVRESFTAYGNARGGSAWSGPISSGDESTIGGISRSGYTSQTVLGTMGLVHLNGRILDAVTGRVISVDPFVSDLQSTQAFNRYSYVFNNPLTHTDPNGFCAQDFPGCFDINSIIESQPTTTTYSNEGGTYYGGFNWSVGSPLSSGVSFSSEETETSNIGGRSGPLLAVDTNQSFWYGGSLGNYLGTFNETTGSFRTLDGFGGPQYAIAFADIQSYATYNYGSFGLNVAAGWTSGLTQFRNSIGSVAVGVVLGEFVAPVLGVIGGAAEGVAPLADEAFHYTFGRYLSSIETNGLRAGSYATDAGELSPLQAQIDLALPPNRGLPDALLRIDLNGLRSAGYEIPGLTPAGRMFNMPGGGMEMQFPYSIPPEFISVIK